MSEIARGAEAVLRVEKYDEQAIVVKERIKKGYRLPELDVRIRAGRTKTEADLLARARRVGVDSPRVLESSCFSITMEWLGDKRVKEYLTGARRAERHTLWTQIGMAIARLHSYHIIHGDLTTSNMLLKAGRVWLIDFGLGKISKRVEDKAIDLYLLYESLKSTHFEFLEEGWSAILKTYSQNYSEAGAVLAWLEKVKKRRRYM